MGNEFTHLHVHSEYSLLDGHSRIKRLAQQAKALGMNALALTDHGAMYGTIEFYQAAKEADIKPIIGVEAYLAYNTIGEKPAGQYDYWHLLLLAENDVGYRNLLKLTTLAHTKGYYIRPRIDKAMLEECSEGLIATSSCLSGEIPKLLLRGDINGARQSVNWYRQVFPDRFFIEIQDHHADNDDQLRLNQLLFDLQRETQVPLVATNDLHYVEARDADSQDILLCIQTGKTLIDPKRMRFDSKEYYLKSPDEMAALFPELPEAMRNTMVIAERCNVRIPFGESALPDYPIPAEFPDQPVYLRHLVDAGAMERFGEISERVKRKLDYELSIINSKGFTSYFLIVWDYTNYARARGIRCLARGSAAGSLVSYCLGITNVDPLRYDLLFERFLNPERKSMPDIDMDFPDDRREEVIRYVARKYGADKVCQLVTFGTLAAKAAVRDVGRVLELQGDADRLARLIPTGPKVTLSSAMDGSKELQQVYQQDANVKKIYDMACTVEGSVRSTGVHAAAVVIARDPLVESVPMQLRDPKDPNSWLIAQYEQAHIEALGLLKMDFLGLSNLTTLQNTQKFIQKTRGIEIDLDRLPAEGPEAEKAFTLLASGETTGIFQFESGAMRRYLQDLKPTCVEDLTAMVALYRPGPMDSIPTFIRAKHGEIATTYLHPSLERFLKETYGVLVYQDQVLLIAVHLASFTWLEADSFRKAMGKKKLDDMAKYRGKFITGCQKNGMDEKVATQLYEVIEPFANYGFNKCAHGSTEIQLPTGGRMTLSAAYANPPEAIMAMWPDGQIRPHKVQRIVRTGRKSLLEIRTASGKSIKVTPEHRLLTTAGYCEAGAMSVGTELIVAPRRVNERMRLARRATMTRLNGTEAQRLRASERMKKYQAARDPEDLRQHMLRMHELHPHLTRAGTAAMHERVKWLYINDPEWKARLIAKSIANTRACYDSGPGYGRCSIASNGMWCASQPERNMCEWLITQVIDFKMHKTLGNGRICDFYFNGIYWEMDGMDREASYFAAKYGDLPYVVVTPEDFQPIVLRHLGVDHATNGDPIISITPCGEAMTYDVEMAPDGPLNYIANRIVSHNSHAAAYGFVAYQTAYLKANYTAEFMAATLTTEASDTKKVLSAIAECRRMGVPVLPPDVNRSASGFTVEHQADTWSVRFGLLAIKNVGSKPIDELMDERERSGPYKNMADICARVDARSVTRSALECLIKAGALDGLGNGSRSRLLAGVDRALALGAQQQKMRRSGQISLFGAVDDGGVSTFKLPDAPEHARDVQLAWEKDLLGFYLSRHPLMHLESLLRARVSTFIPALSEEWAGQQITLGGRVVTARRILTKRGTTMVIALFEDLQGSMEVTVFPRVYEETAALWEEEAKLFISGKIEMREEEIKLIVDRAEAIVVPDEEEAPRATHHLRLHFPRTENVALDIVRAGDVMKTLQRFPGPDTVELRLPLPAREDLCVIFTPRDNHIRYCPELHLALEQLLGPDTVKIGPSTSLASSPGTLMMAVAE